MPQFVLQRSQFLPIGLGEAWAFFSSPRNLGVITPPEMGFVIREPFDNEPAHAGQLISYTVRPVLGIPLEWVTLIEAVEAPYRFVDKQLKGPYKRWWHEHTFEEQEGGVLMKDRVEYELPLGHLGALAEPLFIRGRLNAIFDFRNRKLLELFPPSPEMIHSAS
ncbi:MAG: SRPBCC family protein [Flavobacteriales bacterium]